MGLIQTRSGRPVEDRALEELRRLPSRLRDTMFAAFSRALADSMVLLHNRRPQSDVALMRQSATVNIRRADPAGPMARTPA